MKRRLLLGKITPNRFELLRLLRHMERFARDAEEIQALSQLLPQGTPISKEVLTRLLDATRVFVILARKGLPVPVDEVAKQRFHEAVQRLDKAANEYIKTLRNFMTALDLMERRSERDVKARRR